MVSRNKIFRQCASSALCELEVKQGSSVVAHRHSSYSCLFGLLEGIHQSCKATVAKLWSKKKKKEKKEGITVYMSSDQSPRAAPTGSIFFILQHINLADPIPKHSPKRDAGDIYTVFFCIQACHLEPWLSESLRTPESFS